MEHQYTTIDLDDFFAGFLPIRNPFRADAGLRGCLLGTNDDSPTHALEMARVGEYLDAVHNPDGSVTPGEKEQHVWSVCRSNAGWFIVPGYDEPGGITHIGYVLTSVPWDLDDLVDTEPLAEGGKTCWKH